MDEILALPSGPLARAALSLAQRTESTPVADHSIRSFFFARLLANQDGSVGDAAYDENLLFAACIMHDLGLGTSAPGKERFEVEGADLAVGLLRQHGVATADIDRVWEAIALHSSIGIADRRGLLTYLTHKGVFTDAGRFTDLQEGPRQQVLAGCQPRLIYRTHRGRRGDRRKGFTETDYARFLDAARQQLNGPVVLVRDNLNTHVSRVMRELAVARAWLTVYQLPPYASGLNPVQALWSHLKRSLANLVKQDIDPLTTLVKTRLNKMQYRPGLLDGLLAKTRLD